MTLVDKETREREKIILPHNSCFVLGWESNRKKRHLIKRDKRAPRDKRPDELFNNCERISLTMRKIATYRKKDSQELYGQGISKEASDSVFELLQAFSAENKSSDFDWEKNYGKGFNLLTTTPII